MIYVDRAYDLDLLFNYLKIEKTSQEENFAGRKFRDFANKKSTFLLSFNQILISEVSAQKEKLWEKKISRISKCMEKNEHAIY